MEFELLCKMVSSSLKTGSKYEFSKFLRYHKDADMIFHVNTFIEKFIF